MPSKYEIVVEQVTQGREELRQLREDFRTFAGSVASIADEVTRKLQGMGGTGLKAFEDSLNRLGDRVETGLAKTTGAIQKANQNQVRAFREGTKGFLDEALRRVSGISESQTRLATVTQQGVNRVSAIEATGAAEVLKIQEGSKAKLGAIHADRASRLAQIDRQGQVTREQGEEEHLQRLEQIDRSADRRREENQRREGARRADRAEREARRETEAIKRETDQQLRITRQAQEARTRTLGSGAGLFALGFGRGLSDGLQNQVLGGLRQAAAGIGSIFDGINRRVGFINVRGGVFTGLANAAASTASVVTRVFANAGANVIRSATQTAAGVLVALGSIPLALGRAVSQGISVSSFAFGGLGRVVAGSIGAAGNLIVTVLQIKLAIAAGLIKTFGSLAAGVFEGTLRFAATAFEGAVKIIGKFVNSGARILGELVSKGSEVFNAVLGTIVRWGSAASAVVAGVFLKGIDAASDFQREITRTFVLLSSGQKTPQVFASFTNIAKDLAKQLGVGSGEVARVLTDVVSAGLTPERVGLTGIEEIARRAIQLFRFDRLNASISETTRLVTGTLNAFGLGADKAEETAADLFQIVNSGVITVGELNTQFGKASATGALFGASLRQIGELFIRTTRVIGPAQAGAGISAFLSTLVNPDEGSAKAFEEMGISLRDQSTALRENIALLQQRAAALQGQISEERKAQAAGGTRGGRGRIGLLKEELRSTTDELGKLQRQGTVRSPIAVLEDLAKFMDKFPERLETLARALPNIRALRTAAAAIRVSGPDIRSELDTGARESLQRFRDADKLIQEQFSESLGRLRQKVDTAFQDLGDPFLKPLGRVADRAGGLFESLGTRIRGSVNLKGFAERVGESMLRGIDHVERFVNRAVDVFPVAERAIAIFATNARKSVSGLFPSLDGLGKKAGEVVEIVQGKFKEITGATVGDLGRSVLVGRFDVIGNAIKSTFHATASVVATTIADLVDGITSGFRGILPVAETVAVGIVKAFASAAEFILNTFSSTGAKATLKTALSFEQSDIVEQITKRAKELRLPGSEAIGPRSLGLHQPEEFAASLRGKVDDPELKRLLGKLDILERLSQGVDKFGSFKFPTEKVEAAIRGGLGTAGQVVGSFLGQQESRLRSFAAAQDEKKIEATGRVEAGVLESNRILRQLLEQGRAAIDRGEEERSPLPAARNTEVLKDLLERQGIPRDVIERELRRDPFGLSGIAGQAFSTFPTFAPAGGGQQPPPGSTGGSEAPREERGALPDALKDLGDRFDRSTNRLGDRFQDALDRFRGSNPIQGEGFIAGRRRRRREELEDQYGVERGTFERFGLTGRESERRIHRRFQAGQLNQISNFGKIEGLFGGEQVFTVSLGRLGERMGIAAHQLDKVVDVLTSLGLDASKLGISGASGKLTGTGEVLLPSLHTDVEKGTTSLSLEKVRVTAERVTEFVDRLAQDFPVQGGRHRRPQGDEFQGALFGGTASNLLDVQARTPGGAPELLEAAIQRIRGEEATRAQAAAAPTGTDLSGLAGSAKGLADAASSLKGTAEAGAASLITSFDSAAESLTGTDAALRDQSNEIAQRVKALQEAEQRIQQSLIGLGAG
jgi:TP901 family phage tail tape measure protein